MRIDSRRAVGHAKLDTRTMQETKQERPVINGLARCERSTMSQTLLRMRVLGGPGLRARSRDIAGDRGVIDSYRSQNNSKERGSAMTTDACD
jgi:hypothetical protein